jgi:methionyl-tRNA synthetase
MHHAVQVCAVLQGLCKIFLPFSARKLSAQLNYDFEFEGWPVKAEWMLIPEGHQLGKAEVLFRPVEDEEVETQVQKLHTTKAAASQTQIAPDLKAVKADIT